MLPFANVARELVRLAADRETIGQRLLITTPGRVEAEALSRRLDGLVLSKSPGPVDLEVRGTHPGSP